MTSIGRPSTDYSGKVVNRLTMIKRVPSRVKGAYWLCRCECGSEVIVRATRLIKEGSPHSCGCSHPAFTHGLSHTPTYNSWQTMKSRCYNPKLGGYKNYGGRGIRVCVRWRKKLYFLSG